MTWAGLVTFTAGAAVAALSVTVPEGSGGEAAGLAGIAIMALGAVMAGIGLARRRRRLRHHADAQPPAAYLQDADYRTGRGTIAAMIIAAIYIISPIDFIPDVFLPVGIIDDATALGWLVYTAGREYGRRRQARQLRPGPVPAVPGQAVRGQAVHGKVLSADDPRVTPSRRRSPR